jgi:hypothetical protein
MNKIESDGESNLTQHECEEGRRMERTEARLCK